MYKVMMKINKIDLSWFRGAAASIILNTRNRSVVIYGSNGSGKSSFVDGMEYMLGDGKIEHLVSEYSGTRQINGIRNTHAPDDEVSKVNIKFDDNSVISGELDKEGKFTRVSNPSEFEDEISSWNIGSIILRQDELARFVIKTKSKKYQEIFPLLGLAELEKSADNIKKIARKTRAISNLPELKGETGVNVSRIIQEFEVDNIEKAKNEIDDIEIRIAGSKSKRGYVKRLEDLSKAVNKSIDDFTPEQQKHNAIQRAINQKLGEKLAMLNVALKEGLGELGSGVNELIRVLERSKEYAEALAEEKDNFDCPACGRAIEYKEFYSHLENEIKRLETQKQARNKIDSAKANITASINGVLGIFEEEAMVE